MPIRDNDPRPAYEQVADDLREAIRSGDYKPGDKLPTTRELTEEYDIAPMTVRGAFKILEDENLIVGRQGRGVFVRPELPAVTQPGADPLAEARQMLTDTMKTLQRVNERLDRYEAERDTPAPTGPALEKGGVDLDSSLSIPADLAEAMKTLTEANAALDAADAAVPKPAQIDPEIHRPPEPDLGIEM